MSVAAKKMSSLRFIPLKNLQLKRWPLLKFDIFVLLQILHGIRQLQGDQNYRRLNEPFKEQDLELASILLRFNEVIYLPAPIVLDEGLSKHLHFFFMQFLTKKCTYFFIIDVRSWQKESTFLFVLFLFINHKKCLICARQMLHIIRR